MSERDPPPARGREASIEKGAESGAAWKTASHPKNAASDAQASHVAEAPLRSGLDVGSRPTEPPTETDKAAIEATGRASRVPMPGSTVVSQGPFDARSPSGFDEWNDRPRGDPLIGLIVADRYRIVAPIGRGGMGAVYKVEHTRIGKLLAMKLLTGELSQNPEVVKRFKQEALTVSKLSSPNTVQVFDYGVSEGLTYLVMELVSGDDLGHVLRKRGSLGAAELSNIVIQICNSLSEAHSKGIVHRDIKPENVMITRGRDDSDFAKVLDFGLAKLREGSELNELTSRGAIVGTPYFMSPEQVKGDDVDPRSDIYSLGAVMYRALTGEFPFVGPNPMSVFAKHLTEMPVPPRDLIADIPPGLSDIVMRMLQKEPSERFQKVEDLETAVIAELAWLGTSGIESVLDSTTLRRIADSPAKVAEGKEAAPSPVATRDEVAGYERKLQRRRWIVYGTVIVLPALLLFGGYQVYRRYADQKERFAGVEVEPNDKAAEANRVPFGESVSGTIGKRISITQPDVDVFAIDVPSSVSEVSLVLTALPNLPLCAQLYRKGDVAPMARFCPGKPGLGLDVPRFRLDPGPYLVSITEDLANYGGANQFVMENVSDEYTLTLGEGKEDTSKELEPNDDEQAATPIEPGGAVQGTIGWVQDRDFICAKNLSPGVKYVFQIEDQDRSASQAVLAVTPYVDGGAGAMVRVHTTDNPKLEKAPFKDTDKLSPYSGITVVGPEGGCVILSETVSPFDATPGAVPRGSHALYRVTLDKVSAGAPVSVPKPAASASSSASPSTPPPKK